MLIYGLLINFVVNNFFGPSVPAKGFRNSFPDQSHFRLKITQGKNWTWEEDDLIYTSDTVI